MNPLTNVKNIQKLSELELKRSFKTSWHDQYKDSAWIFIGGLPYDLTEGDIICVFSQYGEVVNLNLVRDKSTGKSKGFCFLCYEDQRSTVLAVDNFNGMKVLGRTIRVDHVTDYKPPKESKNIDDVTKLLYETGCAPGAVVLSVGEPKKPAEEKPDTKEGILQNVKKVKKKKAKKQKKVLKKKSSKKTKKKRRKKDDSSSSSSSSSDSSSSETSSESSSSEEEEEQRGKDKESKGRNRYRIDEEELENGRAFVEKVKVKMEEEEEEKRRRRKEERMKEQQDSCVVVNDSSREGRKEGDGGGGGGGRWKKGKEDSRRGHSSSAAAVVDCGVDKRNYEDRAEDRKKTEDDGGSREWRERGDGGRYDQRKNENRERSESRKDRRGDKRRPEERSSPHESGKSRKLH